MSDASAPLSVEALCELATRRLSEGPEGFVTVVDGEGHTVWASPSWLRFAGRDAAEPYFEGWAARVRPSDLERTRQRFSAAFHARAPFEIEYGFRRADGAMRDILCRGVPVQDEAGAFAGFAVSNIDITDLRAGDERLRASQAQMEAILEHMEALVVLIDAEGCYRFVNQAWERTMGRTRGQVLGRRYSEGLPPAIAAVVGEPVEDVLRTGRPSESEIVFPTAAGPRVFYTRRVPLLDLDGVSLLVCAVATDVTDQRRAAEARAELERRGAEQRRLESLGVMAAGFAHDFNNLLATILTGIELALDAAGPAAPGDADLRAAQDAGRRAAHLTHQVLDYTGLGPRRPEALDVGAALEALRLEFDTTPGIRVVLDLPAATGMLWTEADPGRFDQVVRSLVTNAVESYADGAGEVHVRARRVRIGPERPARCVAGAVLQPGDHVAIEVVDHGSGMDEATQARMFDPFFTTHFVGRGLGLSAALGIVLVQGGGIEVESRPGEGTTMRVLLPALASGNPAAR